jgi:UDP-4-amino-4,6-dideoxy-N-acetyl-beta-L-altrosamine transaminase
MARSAVIPYGRQTIDDDDLAAVRDALLAPLLTTGPAVGQFETAFGSAVGAPHVAVCGNGTQALHLAVLALGLGPGDSVIVPSITFLATANAVRYVGAEVVFADVDADTGLITVETALAAQARAKSPVKAIMPVHIGGIPATPHLIANLARQKNWYVIEDACHALGTTYLSDDGTQHRVGDATHADMCTFSFHPVKTIAMGEGGAVTMRNASHADKIRILRTHGMIRDPASFQNHSLGFGENGHANPWYYEMPEIGFNFRAPDINCALGTSQLAKLSAFVDRRRALAAQYERAFAGIDPRIQLVPMPKGVEPGLHLFRILIDFDRFKLDRGGWMRELLDRGIGTQVHYIPVHYQPYYHARYGALHLPGAERYYQRTLTLPLYPALTDQDVTFVVDTIKDIARLHG